jgi:hypothetical protein
VGSLKKTLSIFLLAGIILTLQHCNDEADIQLPEVSTIAISDITHQNASGGGEVLSDGGAEVSVRGVCWSIEAEPTINDSKTENGSGTGEFTSLLTNLTGATTYHVRAYAINKSGTAYGEEIQFTASPTPTLAVLSTTLVNSITSTTASSGGTITSDGNTPVTARGICWATTIDPTTDNFKTVNSAGTGEFTSELTSLSPGSTYYVRAYATNGVGISYGNEVSFSTNSITLAFYPAKDGTIFNNQAATSPNGNYGAGGSELLQVGYASPSSMYARTLVQFDLSSLPTNAIIESISLEFTPGSSGTFVPEIAIYKMNQTWTEGTTSFCTYNSPCNTQGVAIAPGGTDVTWNEISYSGTGTNPWITSGGTFSAVSSATSVDLGASTILYNSTGLKNDVQDWVSNSATNFGWILKTDFITNSSAMRRFRSREGAVASGDIATAPKLVITYH